MMNWRIVNPPAAPWSARLVAASMSVRRLAPLTLLAIGAALVLVPTLAWRTKRKRL